jgi:hypothetical protein
MDHSIEGGDRAVGVGDQRKVQRRPLCFRDILRPAIMLIERIDGEADRLDVAALELRLQFGGVAEFRRADRREIARMRE